MENFLIVAHRGGHGPYAENTLKAFEHAISGGCRTLEMDMRYDHFRKRFYLEHDFLHNPRNRNNIVEHIVPDLPKDALIFVELKTVAWLTRNFARQFVAMYKKFFDNERTVVMSFNPFILMQLKKLAPEIQRGYLLGNPWWSFLFKRFLHGKIAPQILLLHKRLFNKRNVKFGRAKGMKIMAFVLNNERLWRKALDYGVDGIITDNPQGLQQFLITNS